MPTDLAFRHLHDPIHVRDRAGVGLPFSKGLMATSILATGIETDRAYAIATEVQNTLIERKIKHITSDELADLAADVLTQRAGASYAQRYRSWKHVSRTGRPVIVALGGAPGVGKSTIATRLAVRLGITRIVTTDTIREVLRTVIPKAVLPELHVSSYEADSDTSLGQEVQPSFPRQALAVGAATAALARRLVSERRSAIIEGVHLLPGALTRELCDLEMRPIVIELLLTLEDESLHASHLNQRSMYEPARQGKRHLRHLSTIRTLQTMLRSLASEAKVAEFNAAAPQTLTQFIVDQVVVQVEADAADKELVR